MGGGCCPATAIESFSGIKPNNEHKNQRRCFPGRNKLFFECPAGTAAVATTAAASTAAPTTAASGCTRSIRSVGRPKNYR